MNGRLALGLLVLGLSGCAGQPVSSSASEAPLWLSQYPQSSTLMYAVGSAEIYGGQVATAEEQAATRAKAELVRTLRADVSSSLLVQETVDNDRFIERIESQTKIESRIDDLPGLKISERYVEASQSLAYALASLDRPQAQMMIQQQVSQALSSLTTDLSLFNEVDFASKLRQSGGLLQQVQAIAERLSVLQALGMSQAQLQAEWDELAQVRQQVLTFIDACAVRVTLPGEFNIYLPQLRSELQQLGFPLTMADANLLLDITVIEAQSSRDNVVASVLTGTATLSSLDGEVIYSTSIDVKGSATQLERARFVAMGKLAEQLMGQVVAALSVDTI